MLKGLILEQGTASSFLSFTEKLKTLNKLAIRIWLTVIWDVVVATKPQVLQNDDPEMKSRC